MPGLAFAAPLVLAALIALPAIWWLLRITPPQPSREAFPPFRLLLLLKRQEETPATTPWWLLALRMLIAGLLVLALAGPVYDPNARLGATSGSLAVIVDNSWASATDFDKRRATAENLIRRAGESDAPVSLTFTTDRNPDATFKRADEALSVLAAAKPAPLPADRAAAAAALTASFQQEKPERAVLIADGVRGVGDAALFTALRDAGVTRLDVIGADNAAAIAVTGADNAADRLTVTAARLQTATPQTVAISARDIQGRVLGATSIAFGAGQARASGEITAPFELRNEFARLTVDGLDTAGAVRLLDDSFKRRSVGLISGEAGDRSQPLLSPLYYINRALSPFANLSEANGSDLVSAIPAMIKARPSVIVMADIGRMPASAEKALTDWIRDGGSLVRFAGPRLAAAPADDPLIPTRLREGERALGGSMSWAEPQTLDNYPENSPFTGLTPPDQVLVKRQVLAEPTPELAGLTWASLKDGTPLVTARRIGAGRIVLFHVSAESSWSNLPLSGEFVEMLRRIVQLSHSSNAARSEDGKTVLPPYRLLTAAGALTTEKGLAKPIEAGAAVTPSFDSPPGLYGGEDGFEAVNLFASDAALAPIAYPQDFSVTESGFAGDDAFDLKPWLFAAAAILALADTLAMLILGGAFARRAATAAMCALAMIGGLAGGVDPARADDARPGDDVLMSRLDKTHLAYVITGEAEVDRISERGLAGLSDFLYYRTTLEPGDPVGVDIAKDELSVFPILYWPVDASAAMPSENAISRIDAYMRSGGTVLFDTRDQASSITAMGGVSANTERLRAILARIDIPPLEPVPQDHVLTKAFYLLKSYPGRYSGSPLWVEAEPDAKSDPNRPARQGDGVTPIMITGNDFAGAWAVDNLGAPLLPLVPPDENQREMAYRTGVNIMMYMLTGNYKADQVHVPALLERLGQ
ncbi:DUF4159 domain-containing protein [Rhizobium sp. TRM95796]|uniref:DUF4159 domain-containing protein n=1 Tax=Rhizobium sp. TRM95796 TaxID=2979862 RepID=UPI0021E7A250|nr:DUF4159 domain-containing protein [Rhizobium sp. TRM95796]MCV3764854.1 DUF4159 domain-containing protein [Rhizobium sp. TRM95796]